MNAPLDPPQVVLFDVNETMSDLTGMQTAFGEIGAPEHLAATWFAGVLRDGFALQIAGATTSFADVAAATLRFVLQPLGLDADGAVPVVLQAFRNLDLHPDIVPGIEALGRLGLRLVTLSNGAAAVAEQLLANAEIRESFHDVLSVEDAGAWKPAAAAYEYAAQRCGVDVGELMLVAVHPWDIDGAARAGLRTAWLDRHQRTYPDVFAAAELTVASLPDLAARFG